MTESPLLAWPGGACPVHPDTRVQVQCENGRTATARASHLDWSRHGGPGDIVGYRAAPLVGEPLPGGTQQTAFVADSVPAKAHEFLQHSAGLLDQRGKDYDQPQGERSMGRCVRAVNAITGRTGDRAITEAEGWLLLQVLKDVRQWQNPGEFHRDSAEDCVSYAALKAECLAQVTEQTAE